MHRTIAPLAACVLVMFTAFAAFGQAVRPDVRATYASDGTLVRLLTTWSGDLGAEVYIGNKKKSLHDGEVAGTAVSGHERVIIALTVDDASKPFRIYVVDGKTVSKPVSIARPVDRRDAPFAVAAAATPDGFSVFFQEVQADDGTAAHTYLVKLDKQGAVDGAASEVPVPWSLGAAVWNGSGYHLALFYPGDQNGMRLSMVSLSAAGQPEQHPDWASAPGFISDVHLAAADGKVTAYYRGGKNADHLYEADVSAIRSWGSEPPEATDHGKLAPSKAIAISPKGAVEKVTGASAR